MWLLLCRRREERMRWLFVFHYDYVCRQRGPGSSCSLTLKSLCHEFITTCRKISYWIAEHQTKLIGEEPKSIIIMWLLKLIECKRWGEWKNQKGTLKFKYYLHKYTHMEIKNYFSDYHSYHNSVRFWVWVVSVTQASKSFREKEAQEKWLKSYLFPL